MKLTLLAFLLSGSAAFAFPAHQPDGYRDTGCDPAQQTDVGGYSNNPSCKYVGGGPTPAAPEVSTPDDETPDEETPDTPDDDTPDNGGDTPDSKDC